MISHEEVKEGGISKANHPTTHTHNEPMITREGGAMADSAKIILRLYCIKLTLLVR